MSSQLIPFVDCQHHLVIGYVISFFGKPSKLKKLKKTKKVAQLVANQKKINNQILSLAFEIVVEIYISHRMINTVV